MTNQLNHKPHTDKFTKSICQRIRWKQRRTDTPMTQVVAEKPCTPFAHGAHDASRQMTSLG